MTRKTIAVIFGTRPDTIKLAPVIQALQRESSRFRVVKIATAQHRSMLDQVLDVFKISPDYDLNIMQEKQALSALTAKTLQALGNVLDEVQPDMVLVQGDTSTTFAGSLAAFYRQISIGHVEAGLRTNDKLHPFPEEMNRRLTSSLADLHFAPTETAKKALIREGINRSHIFVTGNTVLDALQLSVRESFRFTVPALNEIVKQRKKIVLVTMHRRENWGTPMLGACRAIRRLAEMNDGISIVFPVHLNPAVQEVVGATLTGLRNVHLVKPLGYLDFVNLMAQSYFIITDSGGIQEEAPALGKPVLVLRTVTERPEAVQFGTSKLVGLDAEKIIRAGARLLNNKGAYQHMATAVNPYGDGKAAQRTVAILKNYFGFTKSVVREFRPPTAHSQG
ncbi:MAG: UDP-N-acetylglucosamine 2-epimerase (non-hydrolyzing) [Bacteroidetes bacterium]|nr:UDP-N-acetylglucosamine 2-epimerase (non-hydrolyzing) [Bacteroidota bacterium]MCW5894938.1 UDP-N-acetylglucosamine 2-epimerase (non-hydrolyzing) [Bacteroidota bacterium]